MPQEIYLTDDARQLFRTRLGGADVVVRAWWQPLDESWYIGLALADGTPIVAAARLSERARLLHDRPTPLPGELRLEGTGAPGRRPWRATHRLLFYDRGEAP